MLIKDIEVGKTYHNGGKRKRLVVGVEGLFVYYQTPTDMRRGSITGERVDLFAKWSKGVVENVS
ncbi:hypothetical protein [Metabacillus sp. Hm71]|uniref:hypothetical protein n=1 Tax=Metabacillus sp. Hm71 TaxID=3450743 RepID=UPI003F4389D7